jgi:hypothetical protein
MKKQNLILLLIIGIVSYAVAQTVVLDQRHTRRIIRHGVTVNNANTNKCADIWRAVERNKTNCVLQFVTLRQDIVVTVDDTDTNNIITTTTTNYVLTADENIVVKMVED